MEAEYRIKIRLPVGHILVRYPINHIPLIDWIRKRSSSEKHPFSPDAIQRLLNHSLKEIVADRHENGSARGGWGRAYQSRYFTDLFGRTVPSDSRPHPHSISFTLWVLEGLLELFDKATSVESEQAISDTQMIDDISAYYRRHFDKKTGGVGPLWVGTDTSEEVAPNVRHASAGFVAFTKLPGFLKEMEATARYIIDSLESGDALEKGRALSLSGILRALYLIRTDKTIYRGLSSNDLRIDKLIARAEMELLSRFDNRSGIWDIREPGSESARIWYTIWILRSLPEMQYSANGAIKELYISAINRIVTRDLVEHGQGLGLPYLPNTGPDIGMTATLLKVLRRDKTLESSVRDDLVMSLLKFLVECHQDPVVGRYSYSWTWAMIPACIFETVGKMDFS